MRSLKGLLTLATLALFFTASAWGACPDDPDCLWVDHAVCGECADDGRNCAANQDCDIGTCTGFCTVGGAACVGDVDCQPNNGLCQGLCANDTTTCYGNGGCQTCVGSTSGPGDSENPFCMVNDAFRSATGGDTIYVKPGTYTQCVDVSPLGVTGDPSGAEDRPVTLLAKAFDEAPLDPASIDETTFDGTDLCLTDPVVTIEGSASFIHGFTVTGGEASGIYVSGGTVTVSHNKVMGNQSVEGAGIAVRTEACNYADATTEIVITENEITQNAAAAGAEVVGQLDHQLGHGGGVHVFALEEFEDGCDSDVTVRIENNVITDNTVKNTNRDSQGGRYLAKGGGVWLATGMEPDGTALITLSDNEISGNGPTQDTAASVGGGVFATTLATGFGAETIVIDGNTIGPNNRSHEGGGLAVWAISSKVAALNTTTDHRIEVKKNKIFNNLGYSSSDEGSGAGASLRLEALDMAPGESVSLEFAQNEVYENLADSSDGGGLRASALSERSVDEPLDVNVTPADRMELLIRDNYFHDNESAVGGAGALLLILTESDPVFAATGSCGNSQLPASVTLQFLRNLVTNNHARNTPGWFEVGAGILTIPTAFGLSHGTIVIEDSTIAGNTIGLNDGGAGGVETLTFAGKDCHDLLDVLVSVSVDRTIVDGNTGYGFGSTLQPAINGDPAPPADSLVTPALNNYVFGNPSGSVKNPYPTPPGNVFATDNHLIDPRLIDPSVPGASSQYPPVACSPVFDLKVCEGTTDTCQDELDCDPGPPRVPCVTGVGFHGNPDISGDSIIDGLDILDLAVSYNSTDAPDPRYLAAADLDHSGLVDGEDLSYMGSQFGQVCQP